MPSSHVPVQGAHRLPQQHHLTFAVSSTPTNTSPAKACDSLCKLARLLLVLLLPAALSAQTGTSGTVTSSDGWTWQAPMPQGNDLIAVWSGSSVGINGLANDVYAVGASGTILHYDGTSWSATGSGVTASNLYAVWGSSSADSNGHANDVYAVGASGTIVHYDGTVWSAESKQPLRLPPGLRAKSGSTPWPTANAIPLSRRRSTTGAMPWISGFIPSSMAGVWPT